MRLCTTQPPGYQVEDGVVQMGDALYYFKHQLIYAVLGVLVLWLVSRLDYQRWRAWAVPILCAAVVLLILVLTPFGVNVNGATRWLKLLLVVGPTYQPSEIAKLGIVLVFAAGMSKRKNQPPRLRRKDPIWKNQLRSFLYWSDLGELLPYVGILIVIALLMLKEPHMSGTILVLAAAAAILFTAGIRWGWFALGGGLMGVIMALIVFVGGYNSDRIKTWLNPWWDPGDKGYQIVQSLYAVASGGLTGLALARAGRNICTYRKNRTTSSSPSSVRSWGSSARRSSSSSLPCLSFGAIGWRSTPEIG